MEGQSRWGVGAGGVSRDTCFAWGQGKDRDDRGKLLLVGLEATPRLTSLWFEVFISSYPFKTPSFSTSKSPYNFCNEAFYRIDCYKLLSYFYPPATKLFIFPVSDCSVFTDTLPTIYIHHIASAWPTPLTISTREGRGLNGSLNWIPSINLPKTTEEPPSSAQSVSTPLIRCYHHLTVFTGPKTNSVESINALRKGSRLLLLSAHSNIIQLALMSFEWTFPMARTRWDRYPDTEIVADKDYSITNLSSTMPRKQKSSTPVDP